MLSQFFEDSAQQIHILIQQRRDFERLGGSTLIRDVSEIENTLLIIVAQVSSLEELKTWLESQKCIQSVRLEDFLIKTNPPQRELIIECKDNNESVFTKIINIFVLNDGEFSLNQLRDP